MTSAALHGLNTCGVTRLLPYLLLGILLWGSMFFSGNHATLAGAVLAMMIPINGSNDDEHSLLHSMEQVLSFWVAFGVLPIFGFANAGVSIASSGPTSSLSPLGLGIVAGLFLGKQVWIAASVFLTASP